MGLPSDVVRICKQNQFTTAVPVLQAFFRELPPFWGGKSRGLLPWRKKGPGPKRAAYGVSRPKMPDRPGREKNTGMTMQRRRFEPPCSRQIRRSGGNPAVCFSLSLCVPIFGCQHRTLARKSQGENGLVFDGFCWRCGSVGLAAGLLFRYNVTYFLAGRHFHG